MEDGWIEWTGGECPVAPETLVDVMFRGPTYGMEPDRDHGQADDFYWPHDDEACDIVSYRVAQS